MPITIDGDPSLGLFQVYYAPLGDFPLGVVVARTAAGARRAAVRFVLDYRLRLVRNLKARHGPKWRTLHPEAEKAVDRGAVFADPLDMLDVYKESS